MVSGGPWWLLPPHGPWWFLVVLCMVASVVPGGLSVCGFRWFLLARSHGPDWLDRCAVLRSWAGPRSDNDCQQKCTASNDCKYYVYWPTTKWCRLHSSCSSRHEHAGARTYQIVDGILIAYIYKMVNNGFEHCFRSYSCLPCLSPPPRPPAHKTNHGQHMLKSLYPRHCQHISETC